MSDNNPTSDWIYILLTLGAAVISILKSGKKKNTVKERIPEIEYPEEIPVFEEISSRTEAIYTKEIYPKEKKYRFTPEEEGGRILNPKNNSSDSGNTGEEGADIEFDARKALIYSEIMNRKYN